MLDDPQKRRILDALNQRGANLPCPRCGNKHFVLVDGYFSQSIQSELTGLILGGPSLPSVVIVCNKCGFLCQHALGVLGLITEESKHTEEVKP